MTHVAFIGFGEAGAAFARRGDLAFDIKTIHAASASAKHRDYDNCGVTGCETAAEALAEALTILSLVTADQALVAAEACAPLLQPRAIWLDMNSVAPGTKRAAREVIEAAGGRYADVAVMAPVDPAGLAVPLLVSGAHGEKALEALRALGFSNINIAGTRVGDAAAIKMIRSVMVKGTEALTAECLLAADRAGVTAAVLASLDASAKTQSWVARADYNLDRMIIHGLRRAAEMEEAAKTLVELGIEPAMTRGTIARQRELGGCAVAPPDGLAGKLAILNQRNRDEAA